VFKFEDNELICRIGRKTPMGEVFRRYWMPACLSDDLKRGGAPLRLRLLGESLVAFRDTHGSVGVLDEHCPHRGASLVLGRNEDCGLRCLFHGWKFGTDGTIHETPNMPDSRFRERVRAGSYAVREGGGIVWAYLGPPDEEPELPTFQWSLVPAENRLIVPVHHDCNYLQSLEGFLDSSHVGMLHTSTMGALAQGALGEPATWQNSDTRALSADNMPRLEVERTDFGFHYAAVRRVGSVSQVRVSAYVAPFLVFIPPGGMAFMAVPRDDTHTEFWNIFWHDEERLVDGPGHDALFAMFSLDDEILSATGMKRVPPPVGPLTNQNTYVQDRAGMEAGRTFSGLPGITAEDAAMAVSMGPLLDRSNEHLVPADLAVIRVRRLLLEMAQGIAAGNLPVGLETKTDSHKISAASGEFPSDAVEWRSLVPGHMTSEEAK
jgi:phthalate 4,5-dioxygenase oxygenase subunit